MVAGRRSTGRVFFFSSFSLFFLFPSSIPLDKDTVRDTLPFFFPLLSEEDAEERWQ